MQTSRPPLTDSLRRLLVVLGASSAAVVAFLLLSLLSRPQPAAASSVPIDADQDPVAVIDEASAPVNDVVAEPAASAGDIVVASPDALSAAAAAEQPAQPVVETDPADQAQPARELMDGRGVPLDEAVAPVTEATEPVGAFVSDTPPVVEVAAPLVERAPQADEAAASIVERATGTVALIVQRAAPVVEIAEPAAPLVERPSQAVEPLSGAAQPIIETPAPIVDAAAPVTELAAAVVVDVAAPVNSMPIAAPVVTPATAAPPTTAVAPIPDGLLETAAPSSHDTAPITLVPGLQTPPLPPATTTSMLEAHVPSIEAAAAVTEPTLISVIGLPVSHVDAPRPGRTSVDAPSGAVRTETVPSVGAAGRSSTATVIPSASDQPPARQGIGSPIQAVPIDDDLGPAAPFVLASTPSVADRIGAPPAPGPAPLTRAVPAAGMTTGDGSGAPELGQQLATLTASAGAFLFLSQRVTTRVSWRSRYVLTSLERPG